MCSAAGSKLFRDYAARGVLSDLWGCDASVVFAETDRSCLICTAEARYEIVELAFDARSAGATDPVGAVHVAGLCDGGDGRFCDDTDDGTASECVAIGGVRSGSGKDCELD